MSGIPSLSALEGRWRLNRLIRHNDGVTDSFDGTATFSRAGARLVQDEEGFLQSGRGGAKLKATRRYIWTAADGRLDIAFDDMRPFHSVPLNVAQHETVHLCDPDRYQVAYDLRTFPDWTTTWTVEGPRKDYVMETRFQRATP